MSSKGFIELLKLNDRGVTRAKQSDGHAESEWSGVAFRVGHISLVIPLGEVAEVVGNLSYTPVPMSKNWMKGVSNLRGRLLPLINLSQFIGVNVQEKTAVKNKVIVLDQKNMFCGLIVDQVYGIQHFNKEQFVGGEVDVQEGINPYLQGYFKRENNRVWHVFMLSKLVKDEKYLNVAV